MCTLVQVKGERFTEKLVSMFAPNLILGVSDEVPPPADIERVRAVGKFVAQLSVGS